MTRQEVILTLHDVASSGWVDTDTRKALRVAMGLVERLTELEYELATGSSPSQITEQEMQWVREIIK